MSKREIEFWFDFGSNYSYIAAMRIEALAGKSGVQVCWRPFLLGPVFESLGWESVPFVQQELKGAYVWKDMARQCAKYGVPWSRPSSFPRPAVYTMRVAAAYSTEPWVGEFCRRVMSLNFVEDRDIHLAEVAVEVLDRMGLPGEALVRSAQLEPERNRLRDFGSRARELGIFGAPTFFVRGEMFWGNDRLEDALSFATAA